MKKCSFKYCKNIQRPNVNGVTFFRMPKRPFKREQWTDVLKLQHGDPAYVPYPETFVCSDHFDEKDIFVTPAGKIRLTATSVPRINPIRDKKSSIEDGSADEKPDTGNYNSNIVIFNNDKPRYNIDTVISIGDIDVKGEVVDDTQITLHDNPFLPGTKFPENKESDTSDCDEEQNKDHVNITPVEIKIEYDDTQINDEVNGMKVEDEEMSIDKFGEYVVETMKKMPLQDALDLQPQIIELINSVMNKNKEMAMINVNGIYK